MPRIAIYVLTAALGSALLSACDNQHSVHAAAPAGTVAASLQPRPDKPLFGAPIIKDHDVLPPAKADTKIPLPPAVPLASVQAAAAAPSTAAPPTGAVNPAAGMAAPVTDSKGAAQDADGKK